MFDAQTLPGGWHPRYQPVGSATQGAFGNVVLAVDKAAGARVALKLIPRSQAGAGVMAAEVLNQMRLHHPHIINLKEVFLTDKYLVLVLEWAGGGDLQSHIPKDVGLEESTARWVFQQLLFSLHYCHQMGIAHRDIKPENLLLMEDPTALRPIIKLADFGLSIDCGATPCCRPCCTCGSVHGTPSALVGGQDECCCSFPTAPVGTPSYMAPEVVVGMVQGESPYDPMAADVWSCGVLLYTLLTGRSPFSKPYDEALGTWREKLAARLRRIMRGEVAPLPPGISPPCRQLLASMLSLDPRARPTLAQILAHPWCCQEVGAGALLLTNAQLLAHAQAHPLPHELLLEVSNLLREASAERDCAAPCPPTAPSSPATPPNGSLAPKPRHGSWASTSSPPTPASTSVF